MNESNGGQTKTGKTEAGKRAGGGDIIYLASGAVGAASNGMRDAPKTNIYIYDSLSRLRLRALKSLGLISYALSPLL